MTTRVVNTHEAKSRLSELIREAHEGFEVILARNGQPVARIVPWRPAHPARVAGACAGKVHYDHDLATPDEAIAALFEASGKADLP